MKRDSFISVVFKYDVFFHGKRHALLHSTKVSCGRSETCSLKFIGNCDMPWCLYVLEHMYTHTQPLWSCVILDKMAQYFEHINNHMVGLRMVALLIPCVHDSCLAIPTTRNWWMLLYCQNGPAMPIRHVLLLSQHLKGTECSPYM